MRNRFHIITERPDKNGDYTFIKDNKVYAHLNGHNIDLAKTVYAKFNTEGRKNLNVDDPSWDVTHIDGDFTNNDIKNLKYIIK